MKKAHYGLALVFLSGLGVYAYWDRSPVTPEQELALQALAARYIDAACQNPRELAAVVAANTTVSPNLLERTTSYLEELIETEGTCYGHSKRSIKNDSVRAIYELADFLIDNDMATELGVKDFYDCLVDIEHSYVDLVDSSRRIFDCVEMLDIRGFWWNMLVKPPENMQPIMGPDEPPITIIMKPSLPGEDTCLSQCYNDCAVSYPSDGAPGIAPMPHPIPVSVPVTDVTFKPEQN